MCGPHKLEEGEGGGGGGGGAGPGGGGGGGGEEEEEEEEGEKKNIHLNSHTYKPITPLIWFHRPSLCSHDEKLKML